MAWLFGLGAKQKMDANFQNNYSHLDRILHKFAFRLQKMQLILSEMEDDIYAKTLKNINCNSPVFITALPRAGTTLLLELFYQQGEFASHNYRDMPFLLMPMLWNQFSMTFGSSGDKNQERAHGDGMEVSLDSPEALEEILWKQFFPGQYQKNYIDFYSVDQNKDFNAFFRSHMKKIISLRNQSGEMCRYISKNNLNICRLNYLVKTFPESKILIPIREPLQHSASMLRQHLNFIKLHKREEFSQVYMKDVGHFDFGLNLKPVNFSHWMDTTEFKAEQIGFWLDYWAAAYESMAKLDSPNIRFFCYDTFKQAPRESLESIADFIGVRHREPFIAQAARIKEGHLHAVEVGDCLGSRIELTEALYNTIKSNAINV